MIDKKPHILFRFLLIGLLYLFASLEHNPIIRLEAILGLSPSNIEKIFDVKSIFSGMSEGVYQLGQLDLQKAMEANFLTPFVLIFILYSILSWRFPKLDSRKKEITFFGVIVVCSVLVNIVN
jgi:hypothetical protein